MVDNVTVLAVNVYHLEVEHFYVIFFDEVQNILDAFCHSNNSFWFESVFFNH